MVAAGGLFLSSCAGGRILDGLYIDERKGFRVQLLRNGWQVMESSGADLVLRDTRSEARIAVSASCPGEETGPLPALVRHLFFGLRQVKQLRQECIQLDGVAGLETVIAATWEGTPVQVRSIVMRRRGCLYDLLFVAPPESYGDRSMDFESFLRGWRFLSDEP
jgi:hypothetical protein